MKVSFVSASVKFCIISGTFSISILLLLPLYFSYSNRLQESFNAEAQAVRRLLELDDFIYRDKRESENESRIEKINLAGFPPGFIPFPFQKYRLVNKVRILQTKN
ncbi:hypothetical protein PRIPAC_86204 [Pristionchus pacificus]|uniref:Uncharacterized protein n=1 Tax=Pristionchus pacificus TaxID=54126 RepID=A0A2A6BKH5_PRIPA|nr:hypothetical protein PRIPAC_86204 [Pristionchus pacificus]|eukprot:PDM66326.1 hypothetical protein PRIPAC_47743 [Pristionchus pacificus]